MSPFGGDEGVRTPDPLLAKQVLSQLSYTPIIRVFNEASQLIAVRPQKSNNIIRSKVPADSLFF